MSTGEAVQRSDIIWKDEYSLGFEEVDAQHRYLFQLAEDILDASREEAKDILLKLYTYTEVHFHKEEKLMATHDYPELGVHARMHSELIHDMNETCRCGVISDVHLGSLVALMMKWVKQHIMVEDQKFAQYLKRINPPSL